MEHNRSAASRYRERAEEVRTIAKAMHDSGAREILYAIAEDYEHMARQRDQSTELKTLLQLTVGSRHRGSAG